MRFRIYVLYTIAFWIGMLIGQLTVDQIFAAPASQPTTAPTLMQSLQSLLDANAGTMKLKAIQAIFVDGSTQTVTPIVATTPSTKPATVPTTAPATKPATPPIIVKTITQAKTAWAHVIGPGVTQPTTIANEHYTDGGGIQTTSTAPLYITNVSNDNPNHATGGHYALAMLWPSAKPDGTQQAVSKAVIDERGCTIYQGDAEAIFRAKCDDLIFTGGHLYAKLQPNGQQIKPMVELRHGKSMEFVGTIFDGGWPEVGEQMTAQPDGTSKLEASQQIGTAKFTGCYWTKWQNPASKSVVSRKPGVQHVVYTNCVGPDGKTFSRTE